MKETNQNIKLLLKLVKYERPSVPDLWEMKISLTRNAVRKNQVFLLIFAGGIVGIHLNNIKEKSGQKGKPGNQNDQHFRIDQDKIILPPFPYKIGGQLRTLLKEWFRADKSSSIWSNNFSNWLMLRSRKESFSASRFLKCSCTKSLV